MPHALITLPDVYETVTRRVSVDVMAQLARIMRLPETTKVYLPGVAEVVPLNGGTFGDCCDSGVKYPGDAKLVVRFNEELDEAYTLVTPVNNNQHSPIFHDDIRDITLTPVYRYVDLIATIEYTAPNIVVVQRWLDEMRARISMLRAELYQTLEYHYGIPRPVTGLLKHIHETMEGSEAPTGDTFEEYFEKYQKVPTKVVTTLIDTHPMTVVPEKQFEVLGWFDFTTTPPQPDKNDVGTFTCSFTYTLHYNRPMQLFCRYPIVAHNRSLDKQYRPAEPYESFKKHTRRVSQTKGSFDRFQETLQVNGVPYIHHPDIDDWVPDFVPHGRLTFFSGLLRLTATDRRSLVDLFNLGDFTFNPYFLEYFTHEGNRLFSKLDSVFEFRLYENNRHRNDVNLQLRPNTLTIETDVDLDLTRYYHLQISIHRNWYQVGSACLKRLRKYPAVLYTLLRALGVYLGGGQFKDLVLLGSNAQPPAGTPAECSLIGDPAEGGTWPWPWLEAEWGDIPWPGDNWEGNGWPGGGWESDPWPAEQSIPTWPGDVNYVDHRCGGEVTNADLQKAIAATDDLSKNYIDNRVIGSLMVLYSQILSRKRRVTGA